MTDVFTFDVTSKTLEKTKAKINCLEPGLKEQNDKQYKLFTTFWISFHYDV